MQAVKVKVIDTNGQVVTDTTHNLPVEIGREFQAGRVHLQSDNLKISRLHAVISHNGTSLQLTDKSSNGLVLDGRRIKGGSHPLNEASNIEIYGFTLDVTPVGELEEGRSFTSSIVAPPGTIGLLLRDPGDMGRNLFQHTFDAETCLVVHDGSAPVERFRRLRCSAGVDKNEYAGSTAVVFFLHEGAPYVSVIANASNAETLYNRDKIIMEIDGALDLHPGDTFVLGNSLWVGVVAANEEYLSCGNPDCQVLNEYKPEDRCWRCGWDLTAGGALTQILKPGS